MLLFSREHFTFEDILSEDRPTYIKHWDGQLPWSMWDLELLRGQVYGNTCKGLPGLGESCPYLWGLSWLNQLIREDPPKKGWPASLSLETELHVREKVSKDSTSVTLLPECRCNMTRPLQLLLQWLPAMVNRALQLWAFLLPQVASAQQRGKKQQQLIKHKASIFFLSSQEVFTGSSIIALCCW